MRAVGALAAEPPYKDRIVTEIVPMDSEKGKASQAKYEWGRERHGLVVLDEEGKALAVLKGHSWGGLQPEIATKALKEAIDPLLE